MRRTLIGVLSLLAPSAWAAPPNDACTQATVIGSVPFATTLDVSGATNAGDDPGLPCLFDFDPGAQTVWFRYTAGKNVVLDLSTAGSDYDTTLAVHPDACGALGPFLTLACNDDDLALGEQSRLFVALDQGQTVLIEVTGGGSLTLDVRHAAEGHPGSDGPEFQVNTYTTYDQGYYFFPGTHALCANGAGEFVAVWQSEIQDGDDWGVFGQRFAADGSTAGGEFQVAQHTIGEQSYPAVACDPGGGFVVVWEGLSAGGDGVHARRFDGAGAALTGDIDVALGNGAGNPSVAVDGSGNFLVTYDGISDVFVRPYDASGAPLGPAVQLDAGALSDVAGNAAGDFVVVWEDGATDEIRGRRLDASAGFVGSQFTANVGTFVSRAHVAVDPAGNFVVAWTGDDVPLGYKGIQARRFDSGGTPGPVLRADAFDDANVVTSDVAMDDGGNFVVVWEDYYYSESVLARRFRADGAPIGDIEFAVPAVREYMQHAPHVAAQPGGDFVVSWVGYDGYEYGAGYFAGGYAVKAQRLRVAPPPPCPPAPRTGCKQPLVLGKGQIQLRDKSPDEADNVTWKWVKGEATTALQIGDPVATDGFAFCVYDAADGLVMEGEVPPGGTCSAKPCWKDLGGSGFKFIDKAGTRAGGIRKLVLKTGLDGSAKLILKGKGAALDMPELPLAVPVRAQLASDTGACWEAEFQASGVLDDSSAEFHATAFAD